LICSFDHAADRPSRPREHYNSREQYLVITGPKIARVGPKRTQKTPEQAVVIAQLAKEDLCAKWRTSEPERAGCIAGMRLAAIELLSQYREALQNVRPNDPV
jgi:hypothetical protein